MESSVLLLLLLVILFNGLLVAPYVIIYILYTPDEFEKALEQLTTGKKPFKIPTSEKPTSIYESSKSGGTGIEP